MLSKCVTDRGISRIVEYKLRLIDVGSDDIDQATHVSRFPLQKQASHFWQLYQPLKQANDLSIQ